jgi:prepilin-type N-terminal cleavage/methylation domain-containing protein
MKNRSIELRAGAASSAESGTSARRRRQAGVTLIEVMTVVGVVGVLAMVAVPRMGEMLSDRQARIVAMEAADLVRLARAEAIRTGEHHVVFFGPPGTTDPNGTAILHTDGSTAPVLALRDGPPATSNCRIDAGENRQSMGAESGLSWGVSDAGSRAPGDEGAAAFSPPQASGSTFADPASNAVNWVLFRPDGIPVVFTGTGGDCGTLGRTGTGGAAIYITSGRRDYAIVITPIGSVRIHSWPQGGGAWNL